MHLIGDGKTMAGLRFPFLETAKDVVKSGQVERGVKKKLEVKKLSKFQSKDFYVSLFPFQRTKVKVTFCPLF